MPPRATGGRAKASPPRNYWEFPMSLRRPSVTGLVLLLAGWTPSSAGLDEGRGPVPPPAGTPRPAPAQARPARDAKADPPRPAPPPKPAGEDAPTAPPGPEDLVSQAEKAETNGDLEGAIRLLEQALK